MVMSKRVANAKTAKFHNNIHKRGAVPDSSAKKENGVGPLIVGFFLFVVGQISLN